MPQSLSNILIHLVFSTKYHEPVLPKSIWSSLFAYLATLVRNQGCECYIAGGVADHVHLAIRLSRTITIAKLVEHIKVASSKWVKLQEISLGAFSWQRGYGAFSVNPKGLTSLRSYIANQEEHHSTVSYQTEYRDMLGRCGVEYDERYMWD